MFKVLRERFNSLFLARMRDPSPDKVTQKDRDWLTLVREAIVSGEEQRKKAEEPVRESVKMSLHRHV